MHADGVAGNICQALPAHPAKHFRHAGARTAAAGQGLTLVYFSAQRKRFLWDRGCM